MKLIVRRVYGLDDCVITQQTRNVIVTFSIGFKLVTLNLTFENVQPTFTFCVDIFLMCNEIR